MQVIVNKAKENETDILSAYNYHHSSSSLTGLLSLGHIELEFGHHCTYRYADTRKCKVISKHSADIHVFYKLSLAINVFVAVIGPDGDI